MQIQVNTDNHVEGGEELTRQVEGELGRLPSDTSVAATYRY